MSPSAVPGEDAQPATEPIDEEAVSVPLDLDEGEDVEVGQQNTGVQTEEGGGEWPDPETPPRGPAPGTVDPDQ